MLPGGGDVFTGWLLGGATGTVAFTLGVGGDESTGEALEVSGCAGAAAGATEGSVADGNATGCAAESGVATAVDESDPDGPERESTRMTTARAATNAASPPAAAQTRRRPEVAVLAGAPVRPPAMPAPVVGEAPERRTLLADATAEGGVESLGAEAIGESDIAW